MRVRVDGLVRTGDAVDLRQLDVSGRRVVAAIRDGDAPGGGADGDAVSLAVECPSPTPVHEYVGHVRAGMTVQVRAALATVARQRGLSAPQDEELAAVESELSALEVPPVDLSGPRRRLATDGQADVERLREQVATHRGAKRAYERLDADPGPAAEQLAETAARLSDAETERVAAEQALDRARERARKARDVRERRLRLQDRRDNLRRAARRHLAADLCDQFVDALDVGPADGQGLDRPSAYEGDPVSAALAVASLADNRAPVVLAVDRFRTAAAAARRLDGPVVLV